MVINDRWEGKFCKQKEVAVYYKKLPQGKIVVLTAKARYGEYFEGVYADFDQCGKLIGLEVIDASEVTCLCVARRQVGKKIEFGLPEVALLEKSASLPQVINLREV